MERSLSEQKKFKHGLSEDNFISYVATTVATAFNPFFWLLGRRKETYEEKRVSFSWRDENGRDTSGLRSSCVSEAKWRRCLYYLQKDDELTVELSFLDGSEYLAPEVVGGDVDTILVRVNGVTRVYERCEIWRIVLVARETSRFLDQSSNLGVKVGRVSAWKGVYGFLVDEKGVSFYFEKSTIFDSLLVESLLNGNIGQEVEFQMVASRCLPTQSPKVNVLKMVQDAPSALAQKNQHVSGFQAGHLAMIEGRVDEAERIFTSILRMKNHPKRDKAIKNLAQMLHARERSQEAFNLIEKYRKEFPQSEQVQFDMMEVHYLQGASRIEDAVHLVEKILQDKTISDKARVFHEHLLKRLKSKRGDAFSVVLDGLKTGSKSAVSAVVSFLKDKSQDGLSSNEIKARKQVVYLAERIENEFITDLFFATKNFTYGVLKGAFARFLDEYSLFADSHEKESSNGSEFISYTLIPLVMALRDLVEREMTRIKNEPINLEIEHRDGSEYRNESGVITLRLAIRSTNKSSRPLNLAVAIREQGQDGRYSKIADTVIGGGGWVPFDVVVSVSESELKDRQGTVILSFVSIGDDRFSAELSIRYVVAASDVSAFAEIQNPYKNFVRKPAKPPCFVGRGQLLERIREVFSASEGGRAIALCGGRRSGKTSIRKNLAEVLSKDKFRYDQVSLHGLGCKDVMKNFVTKIEIATSAEFPRGNDYAQIPDSYPAAKIEYVSHLVKASGRAWVVAIDEMNDLYDYAIKSKDNRSEVRDFLRVIKDLLEEDVMHVIVLGKRSLLRLKSLFANELAVMEFEILTNLTFQNVRELAEVQLRTASGESRFLGKSLDLLYEYTGGFPVYVMIYCDRIVRYLNEHRLPKVDEGVVRAITAELCEFRAEPLLDEARSKRNPLSASDFEFFFDLSADGVEMDSVLDESSLPELYYELARKDVLGNGCPEVDFMNTPIRKKMIHAAIDNQIVWHSDGQVRFRMGLFGEWLRKNPGRTLTDFYADSKRE